MTPPALLSISGLAKQYPHGVAALRGVDLTVRPGELVALLGPNGSGKSTLLRCVVRLISPDAGSVQVGGVELTRLRGAALRAARAEIGMIFQRSSLVRRRSARDNVAAGALGRHHGLRSALGLLPAIERERAGELLAKVGLDQATEQRADTLSGGQAQRAAIARALAQRPKVLLADEPVASLDPAAASATMRLLAGLAHGDRLGVLCVLHQPDLARRYADRIVALDSGRVVLDAPAGDVPGETLARLTESTPPS
ncbi:MAG TPA: ATP-binding cassette domain-containing protein [Pseudonocardia sp.]|nr:ATP-binding cassette domain-containing protein [Pseudonocardia sp.]